MRPILLRFGKYIVLFRPQPASAPPSNPFNRLVSPLPTLVFVRFRLSRWLGRPNDWRLMICIHQTRQNVGAFSSFHWKCFVDGLTLCSGLVRRPRSPWRDIPFPSMQPRFPSGLVRPRFCNSRLGGGFKLRIGGVCFFQARIWRFFICVIHS